MTDRVLHVAAWVIYLYILAALKWDALIAVLESRDAAAWAQAIGTVAAVFFATSATRRLDREQATRARQAKVVALIRMSHVVGTQAAVLGIIGIGMAIKAAEWQSLTADFIDTKFRSSRALSRASLERIHAGLNALPIHDYGDLALEIEELREITDFLVLEMDEVRAAFRRTINTEPTEVLPAVLADARAHVVGLGQGQSPYELGRAAAQLWRRREELEVQQNRIEGLAGIKLSPRSGMVSD